MKGPYKRRSSRTDRILMFIVVLIVVLILLIDTAYCQLTGVLP